MRCAAGLTLLVAGCAGAGQPAAGTVASIGSTASATSVDGSSTSTGSDDESSSSGAVESSSGIEEDTTGSATTSTGSIEICDGVDNDEDGLIDEVSAENTNCNGCVLLPLAGFAYWVCDAQVSWDDANSLCGSFGADMASVHSDMENSLIAGAFGDGLAIWVGANDIALEGTLVWSDGTEFGYDNFLMGQPDDGGGVEDCVRMEMGAFWNDGPCENLARYACKAPHI